MHSRVPNPRVSGRLPSGLPTILAVPSPATAEVGNLDASRDEFASSQFVKRLSFRYGALFPMDNDRKYRQHGYMDSDRDNNRGFRDDRQKPQGPRPPLDVTGPRLPRLVQHVAASRCFNCSTTLAPGTDFSGNCPKCNAELHCCKQCTHFEPSTRFQCLKPIPVRISPKDAANECDLFKPRVTVARDAAPANGNGHTQGIVTPAVPAPKNATDARAIFDSLFKKPD